MVTMICEIRDAPVCNKIIGLNKQQQQRQQQQQGWPLDDSTTKTKSTVATTEESSVSASTVEPTFQPPPRALSVPTIHNNINNNNRRVNTNKRDDDVDSDFDNSDFDSLSDTDDNNSTIVVSVLKLRFGTLTIREYPRILGDGVTGTGPPLTIAWDHQHETVYDVEEYETAIMEDGGGRRRLQQEFKIPPQDREAMMRSSGYTRKEIMAATKRATITRNQRKSTVAGLGMAPVHELWEKLLRNSIHKKFGKKKKKEKNSQHHGQIMTSKQRYTL